MYSGGRDIREQTGRSNSRSDFRESHTDLLQVLLYWERRLQLQPSCDHIDIMAVKLREVVP